MLQVAFLLVCDHMNLWILNMLEKKPDNLTLQHILFHITEDHERLSIKFPRIINAIRLLQKVCLSVLLNQATWKHSKETNSVQNDHFIGIYAKDPRVHNLLGS